MPARSRRALTSVLAILTVLTASGCGAVVVLEPGDPVAFVQQPQTSKVLAADGSVLASLHAEQDREEVALDRVPADLVAAVVAVEDRRFFLHGGVDLRSMLRAAVRDAAQGQVEEGGSTITQQYVKNTMLGPVRTVERKLKEAALAYQLERRYSKNEILERYLNTIYFGNGAYGVHAAAARYFGKPIERLGLDESTLLAGLIASPATFDPYEHPTEALARRRVVLDVLVSEGQVGRVQAEAAAAAPLHLVPPPTEERVVAPYAVEEVKRQIANDGRFTALGDTPDERIAAVFTGGLRIHTTLDPGLQAQAEGAVASVLSEPADPSAAVVAVQPETGAVRALVGGRDFYDTTAPHARFNLATQGRRQVGSAFKPIVLAAALTRGVSLDRVFPGGSAVQIDDPRCANEDGPWTPSNYENLVYGPLTLREATVNSVNTVYARLGAELGPTAVVQMARLLGMVGPLDPVCSIALGAEETSPWELAGAYQPFATLGRRHPLHLIDRIETADGKLLFEQPTDSYQVLNPAVAYLVTQTLQEVVRRGTGIAAGIGRPQAGKTGTTDGSADAWFVGYTPDLLAAVWVGFPQAPVPMLPPATRVRVEGGRWPAEIWAALARPALAPLPPRDFPAPEVSLVTVDVDVSRNCLPNPYTPRELVSPRQFLNGTQPTQRCTEPTGPREDNVPSVVGLNRSAAVRLLSGKAFVVEERPVVSKLYPPGYVVRQRPDPGARAEGGRVVVWVSVAARSRSVVPKVVGLPLDEAVRQLEAGGWVVETVVGCPGGGCPPYARRETVFAQDPAGGATQPEHAEVTLRVYP